MNAVTDKVLFICCFLYPLSFSAAMWAMKLETEQDLLRKKIVSDGK